MAGQSQPNLAAEDRDNERAPLLHRTDKHHTDATTRTDNAGDDDAAGAANDGNIGQLIGEEATSLRHRRWISLIASILLIAAFVVILILSGGTCLGILICTQFYQGRNSCDDSEWRHFGSISCSRLAHFILFLYFLAYRHIRILLFCRVLALHCLLPQELMTGVCLRPFDANACVL